MNGFKALVLWGAMCLCVPSYASKVHVMSLDLCTDWLLMALDSEHAVTLSALSEDESVPFDVKRHAWSHHNGELETIIALKPDIILVGQYNAWLLRERLSQLGFRVEVLPLPTRVEDLLLQRNRIAEILELDHDTIASSLPEASPITHRAKVLKLGANGIAAGRSTFENALLEYAGFDNYVQTNGFVEIDLESVVSEPPDRIILPDQAAPALANLVTSSPIWDKLLSPQQQHTTPERLWQCPGPWSYELINVMTAWE